MFSGGGWKVFYFQNSPWVKSQNTAVGVTGKGFIGTLNTRPWLRGTIKANLGEWIDDEFWFSAIPGPSEVKGWRNGVLEFDATDVSTGSAHTNMLSLGPYHGGSGKKTRDGDYMDIKRLVIWAR